MTSFNVAETPDFTKVSVRFWTKESDDSTERSYKKNSCLIRAIAVSRMGDIKGLEARAMGLFRLYLQRMQKNVADFRQRVSVELSNDQKTCF